MSLNIHLYSLCWNEEVMLPYTLRHYSQFCSRMVFFDNGSTDKSIEIINSFPNTEIIPFESDGTFRDDIHMTIKNHCWKSSCGEADFVIVCDCDELLYHEDLIPYLERKKKDGYTVLSSIWCTMVSEEVPQSDGFITNHIQYGKAYYPRYGQDYPYQKTSIFSPDDIAEMNYTAGAHSCNPSGNVRLSVADVGLKNLHYKWLSPEYVMDRYQHLGNRLSEVNIKNGWGEHYGYSKEKLLRTFEQLKQEAVKVI